MTCTHVIVTPSVQMVVCTLGVMELAWILGLCAVQDAEYLAWQDDTDRAFALDDRLTLHEREPEMFSARSDTDVSWPPVELESFEECDRDPALVYGEAIPDDEWAPIEDFDDGQGEYV